MAAPLEPPARLSRGRRSRRQGVRYSALAAPDVSADAELSLDGRLTEQGLALPTHDDAAVADRLLVIACGALAREILALKAVNRWEQLDLTCLPALLHNRPDAIPGRLAAAVKDARARGYRRILIGYADCGTGGDLDRLIDAEGLDRLPGAHCYAFFDGLAAFAARADDEIGAFFLTDFLARQFDAVVWRGLGLDRFPDLRDAYFGHYDRVVYLAQTDDAALTAAAERAAERLGLRFERRFTGYGELASALERALAEMSAP